MEIEGSRIIEQGLDGSWLVESPEGTRTRFWPETKRTAHLEKGLKHLSRRLAIHHRGLVGISCPECGELLAERQRVGADD